MRISRAIRDGRFASNTTMREAFKLSKENGRSVHLMGLVSDGQVHSDLSHLIALLELARDCSFPKERLEVFCAGRILQIDAFRELKGWGVPGMKKTRLRSQDKGHEAEIAAFVDAARRGGPPPIPVQELFEVSRATLEAARQLAATSK